MNDPLQFEPLESRVLLSVSITQKKGLLTIKGDDAGDDVTLRGSGLPGQMDLFVNHSFVASYNGVKNIKALFGAGDNDLEVVGISIAGSVTASLGAGDDWFDLDSYAFVASMAVDRSVFIGGSVVVDMGGQGGDVVEWDAGSPGDKDITIGRNVTLLNFGDLDLSGIPPGFLNWDETLTEGEILIGGTLTIRSGISDNQVNDPANVQIDNVNVAGKTVIELGADADIVSIRNSSFANNVLFSLGGGDDLLELSHFDDGDVAFAGRVRFDGGLGADTFENDPGNVFTSSPAVVSFENFM